MRTKLRIDLETGLMIDVVHPLEVGDDIIETPCDYAFSLPKWDGEKWVEGATEIPTPQPQTPTVEERLQALEQLELERMFGL